MQIKVNKYIGSEDRRRAVKDRMNELRNGIGLTLQTS